MNIFKPNLGLQTIHSLDEALKVYLKPIIGKSKFETFIKNDNAMFIMNSSFVSELVSPINYETLELIGDVVCAHFFTFYLYEKYDVYDKAVITKLNAYFLSKTRQAIISNAMGLYNIVKVTSKERIDIHVREDIFESFIGALNIALNIVFGKFVGDSIVYAVLESIFNNIEIDTKNMWNYTPYRDRLNTIISTMKYKIEYADKSENNGTWKVSIYRVIYTNNNQKEKRELLGTGTAKTKTEAKEIASENAYNNLYEKPEIQEKLISKNSLIKNDSDIKNMQKQILLIVESEGYNKIEYTKKYKEKSILISIHIMKVVNEKIVKSDRLFTVSGKEYKMNDEYQIYKSELTKIVNQLNEFKTLNDKLNYIKFLIRKSEKEL